MFNESSKHEAVATVERIVTGMAGTPFGFETEFIFTTLSAGLAGYPEDGADVRTVMINSDEAMYLSKRSGKNQLTLFGDIMSNNSIGKEGADTP